MWMTVLLLGIAVNLEPTRIGLVPMFLARQRPLLQLLAFYAGNLISTLTFGLLVLFVFHRIPFTTNDFIGAKAQIAVGALALVIAAATALNWSRRKRRPLPDQREDDSPSPDSPSPDSPPPDSPSPAKAGRVDKFTETVRRVLRKGRSPWLSFLVGITGGLPSVDYLAVLVVIGTSAASSATKVAALTTFVTLGSLVVTIPIIGYLLAPKKTLRLLDRFGAWTRSRSQIEYAGMLAAVGFLLIGLGWWHL